MPGGRGADKAGSGASKASGRSHDSKGSSSKGSKGGSGGGKGNDKDKGGRRHASMGDLNDKFGGRDYGKTTNDKDKGSKTTGSSRVTNEVRRNPVTGKFENVHTDYGQPVGTPGRIKQGKVQHGRVTDHKGTREYTGKWGDEAFGRDVSIPGAKTSADIAEKFMEASQFNHLADDAFQDGDYAGWLKFKAKYATTNLGAALSNNISDFQQAPLDYVADMLKNPMIGGAAVMSGLGLTAFGVTAVDAIADYMQMESTPMEALKDLAYGAIGLTPVGEALGPLRGVAKAALDSPEKAAGAAGGLLGTKMGAVAAPNIASALTDNPMVKAGITAAGVAGASIMGRKAVETAMKGGTPTSKQTGPVGMEAPKGDRRESTSPLVASGKEAIQASKELQRESRQPVDLYARTVKQLPHYGLDLPTNNKLPMYGV